MKYKSRLGTRVEEQWAFEIEQRKLKKKFKVDVDGIIKVEKKPVIEVVFEYGCHVMRMAIIISLFILIATGILSLVYMYIAPEVPLKDIFQELISQFKGVGLWQVI